MLLLVNSIASQRALGLNPSWGFSVWNLHVLAMRSRYSGFLLTLHGIRITGDYKLAVDVNVSATSCQGLCVSPVTDWRTVQGVPCLLP